MNTKARKAAQHVMMILADNTPHGPAEYKECLKVVTGAIAGYFSRGMAELLELRKQRDAALKLAQKWKRSERRFDRTGGNLEYYAYNGDRCAAELRAIFEPKDGM